MGRARNGPSDVRRQQRESGGEGTQGPQPDHRDAGPVPDFHHGPSRDGQRRIQRVPAGAWQIDGRSRRIPGHWPFHGGHVRELGERIPPDGGVRVADRVLFQTGLVGVEGSRRAGAGQTRTRASTPKKSAGAVAGRGGGLALPLYEHSLSLAFVAPVPAVVLPARVGGAQEYNEEQLAHGGAAVSTVRIPGHLARSGSSRSRTGRASSSRWPRSSCSRSSCGSGDHRSRSRSTRHTHRRGPDATSRRKRWAQRLRSNRWRAGAT